jgi:hypothetical protein
MVIAEVDEGEGCSGIFVKFEIFKMDVVDKGQVHREEGRDG